MHVGRLETRGGGESLLLLSPLPLSSIVNMQPLCILFFAFLLFLLLVDSSKAKCNKHECNAQCKSRGHRCGICTGGLLWRWCGCRDTRLACCIGSIGRVEEHAEM